MKILIFNWRDIKNPTAGGAEVFTHENARRWVEKGHSITLFTSEFLNCQKEEVIDGVKIIRAGSKYSVYWKAYRHYKEFFKGKFDLIIDGINTIPFFTPLYFKESVVALIYQLAREFWFYEIKFPLSLFGYLIEPLYLRFYKNIPTITISNSTKQDLLNLGFSNIHIVPIGIDFNPLDQIPEKEKDPTLIFLGRLKKTKLPHHAIKAFRMVKESLLDARLWIVGDGYLRKKLERTSCDGVRFFGYVSVRKKQELLSRAHALVMPALREGWGLVITEANACATPAIAYDVPGLRDSIRDGKTGILVKQKNIKALANAIMKILKNNELREKLSEGALEWSRKFSWDKSAEEFESLLKSIAK